MFFLFLQDLTVSVTSLLGENEVRLEEDMEQLSKVHENAFTDTQVVLGGRQGESPS